MAEYARKHDTRPLCHQPNVPDGDAPFADVAGPRYPSPASLEAKAKTTTKPIIMGEYAHAMVLSCLSGKPSQVDGPQARRGDQRPHARRLGQARHVRPVEG